MKIIMSHDVDHITAWEHKYDLIIPKLFIRAFIEYYLGYTSWSEIVGRFRGVFRNKLQNLEELMQFDKENLIPSTFFVGVSNGLRLNYSIRNAEIWIQKIMNEGFDVGVHGMPHDNLDDFKRDYEVFGRISCSSSFGVRMHYLSGDNRTMGFLGKANYLFDSSEAVMKNPYKINGMWEFPLHIMDGHITNKNSKWQNKNLEQCLDLTKRVLDEGFREDIQYFTILYHDDSFSDSYKTAKEWYMWLIRYLQESQLEFTNYKNAIEDLEGENNQ